ncbi:hypothetical protein LXL04_020225 [Taraxacum kok-saghyz]
MLILLAPASYRAFRQPKPPPATFSMVAGGGGCHTPRPWIWRKRPRYDKGMPASCVSPDAGKCWLRSLPLIDCRSVPMVANHHKWGVSVPYISLVIMVDPVMVRLKQELVTGPITILRITSQ